MIESWLRPHSQRILANFAPFLARLGLKPWHLTAIGLVLSSAAAVCLLRASENASAFLWAAGLLTLGGIFDLFDGAVARHTGVSSPAGAMFDSISDRLGEAFVLAGLVVYSKDQLGTMILLLLALSFAPLVSYTRLVVQNAIPEAPSVGLQRAERVILTVAALILAFLWPLPAVTVLAIILVLGSFFTIVHRFRLMLAL